MTAAEDGRPALRIASRGYRLGTARRESLPKIAEMDVEMTTQAEMTFKRTSRSSKVTPIESYCTIF